MRLRHRAPLGAPGGARVHSSGELLSLVAVFTGLLIAQLVQQGPLRAATASAAVEPAAVVAAAPSCSSLAQDVLDDLNDRRRAHGLPDYQFDPVLAAAACAHTARLWDSSPTDGCPDDHQCPGEADPPRACATQAPASPLGARTWVAGGPSRASTPVTPFVPSTTASWLKDREAATTRT